MFFAGAYSGIAQLSIFAGGQATTFTGIKGFSDKDDQLIYNPVLGIGYNLRYAKYEKFKPGFVFNGYYNTVSSFATHDLINYQFKTRHLTFAFGPSLTVNWHRKTRTRVAGSVFLSYIYGSEVKLDYIFDDYDDLHLQLDVHRDNFRKYNVGAYFEIGQDFRVFDRFIGVTVYNELFMEKFFKYKISTLENLEQTRPLAFGVKISFYIGSYPLNTVQISDIQ